MNLTKKTLTLRTDALQLIPARHCDGDAAWVEMTATLEQDAASRKLSPVALAQLVTASLDAAQADYEAECERERADRDDLNYLADVETTADVEHHRER